MRISAEAKERTRGRILEQARRLFVTEGFGTTSTRDLANAAGIAAGTLFNYFASKEALGMTLLDEALTRGEERYRSARRGEEGLEEDLFAHVAAGLRELGPYRGFVGEVIETALSPFSRSAPTEEGEHVRARHLETVHGILRTHGDTEEDNFVAVHLYWTLYLGTLAFWSRDDSPGQEDTLVVLDQSLRLFVKSIRPGSREQGI